MSDPEAEPFDFDRDLAAAGAFLRRQAMALTRSSAAADDLVQDTYLNAIKGRDSFEVGTNFAAWLSRIMRNRFITLKRKDRETVSLNTCGVKDEHWDGWMPPQQANALERIELKEIGAAMQSLPPEEREAFFMSTFHDMTNDEIGMAVQCSSGAAKNRVMRARAALARASQGVANGED
jgi:RNA polymerase sigma-70 factor (ECF subfamily)